jgi:hypothetical protein
VDEDNLDPLVPRGWCLRLDSRNQSSTSAPAELGNGSAVALGPRDNARIEWCNSSLEFALLVWCSEVRVAVAERLSLVALPRPL